MNTLELKGGITEMVAKVNNQELLQHLYELVSDVITQTLSDNTTLSFEQEEQLNSDIEASFKKENLVEHKVALQKMSKWLKE